MCKPSKYINDICSSCHPQDYVKTFAKFTGEINQLEFVNEDGTSEFENEYLYKCVECNARLWVSEKWIKDNAVDL